jgi:hypothetical protein
MWKLPIKVIAFDADDTLWDCQSHFERVEEHLYSLIAPYCENPKLELFNTESGNMADLGYGCKAFTISILETAMRVAGNDLSVSTLSDLLKDCKLYSFETGKYGSVYDIDKVNGKDPYDVFLSGAQSLLRIENPNAKTDKELIIFRDSFGSSVTPLLAQDYKTVTLVDIRYMDSRMLGNFLEFNGQDVLFLYSTLVLNSGTTLK